MKKLLLLLLIAFSTIACNSDYYKAINLTSGKYVTFRTSYPLKEGDTIVIGQSDNPLQRTFFYGKYMGQLPNPEVVYHKLPESKESTSYVINYQIFKTIK